MYDRFAGIADVSRLEFFPWPPEDLRSVVLESDLVFVGGGNTANMLAIWRLHGVDALLARSVGGWGSSSSGSSAGGICWFEQGVTDSFGPQLGPMDVPRVPTRKLLPALGRRGAAAASVLTSC